MLTTSDFPTPPFPCSDRCMPSRCGTPELRSVSVCSRVVPLAMMSFLYNKFLFFEFRVVLKRTGASLSGSQVRERVSRYWTGLGSGPVVFRPNVGLRRRLRASWWRHFGGLGLFLAEAGDVRRELVVSAAVHPQLPASPESTSASGRFEEPVESPAREPGRRRLFVLGPAVSPCRKPGAGIRDPLIECVQQFRIRQRSSTGKGTTAAISVTPRYKKTQQRTTKDSKK